MNFKEITAEDLFGKGVTGLPDTPGLSTTDMQAKFDELVKEVMVPKFNALVRELAVLSGVESVTKELENTETSIPTGSAVAKYIDENGGNATVEEMTWAEYQALPEEEKMDGTLRVITDRKAGVKFGSADISGIGDGTVTGAIAALNSNLTVKIATYAYTTEGQPAGSEITVGNIFNLFNIPETANVIGVGIENISSYEGMVTPYIYSGYLYIRLSNMQVGGKITFYVAYQ
jgi:hypothetical protein